MATIIRRSARNTITPVLLNYGDILEFTLASGKKRIMKLLETNASIMRTNVKSFVKDQVDGGTLCQFACKVLIDGHEMMMQRYLPCQESFCEPYLINGMRIWLDAVQDYFEPFTLKHGRCKPRAQARFAVSDAKDPVGPGLVKWYPNEDNFISVANCYVGDDVWMGPYLGGAPHGGLDVNMPKNTPLYAPIDLDKQWLHTAISRGEDNNRWRGIRKWPDGSVWTLQVAHIINLLVKEHTPLEKGKDYAQAAGVAIGWVEHSHFIFMVDDEPTNRVDDCVEVEGRIVSESDSAYMINVNGANGVAGWIPKSYALYIQRRFEEYSIFMVPEKVAKEKKFSYKIPKIPLDAWYLFWQMFENDKARKGLIHAHIAPVEPAKTGQAVFFRSDGSRAGAGSNHLSYYWTFGDGGGSNEANPTHTYARTGLYPVSLVVNNGRNQHQLTQHITVEGRPVDCPALSLTAPDEVSFRQRPAYVTDVYGPEIQYIPHTLHFVARHTRPRPEAKIVELLNMGSGDLGQATISITYEKAKDWLQIDEEGKANQQRLSVSIDASELDCGTYMANITVACAGALNSPQSFLVSLQVKSQKPKNRVIIDDRDPEFYATSYFWVGGRFRFCPGGYKNFYLTNGARAKKGEYFRFTPDLEKGKYRVSFVSETPFDKTRFQVQVHHVNGDSIVWVEPGRSRNIGIFTFREGTDGFVKVLAEKSQGEILADAIQFEKIGSAELPTH